MGMGSMVVEKGFLSSRAEEEIVQSRPLSANSTGTLACVRGLCLLLLSAAFRCEAAFFTLFMQALCNAGFPSTVDSASACLRILWS